MKPYNKMVRDSVPDIIEESGFRYKAERISSSGYFRALEAKLQEEINEFVETESLEELADIMEVVFAIAKAKGYSEEDLAKEREKKRKLKGGFEQGIILKAVDKSYKDKTKDMPNWGIFFVFIA